MIRCIQIGTTTLQGKATPETVRIFETGADEPTGRVTIDGRLDFPVDSIRRGVLTCTVEKRNIDA